MPCDSRTTLANAIAGTYEVHYLAPNEFGTGFTNATAHRVGAIKADTLRITPRVEAEPIYSDYLGPRTPIDSVLFPGADTINFTLIEINHLAAKKLLYPYSRVPNTLALRPGVSGEKPIPGNLRSQFEGRLRLVPLNGNLSYWDNDLVLETGNQVPSGLSIRDYFHVGLDPEGDTEENYKAGLVEIPVQLIARLCRDTVTGQWRTHGYVSSVTAAL